MTKHCEVLNLNGPWHLKKNATDTLERIFSLDATVFHSALLDSAFRVKERERSYHASLYSPVTSMTTHPSPSQHEGTLQDSQPGFQMSHED